MFRCRIVLLYFNLQFEFPSPCFWVSRIVQLDLLSSLRRNPLLQRSRLSSSEEWIEISQCELQSESGSPTTWLSTKTVILSTCSCLRNLNAALGFPTRHRAARFSGIKSNSRGSLIPWVKCFAVSARSNLSWAKYESRMHGDLYRVASSLFKIGLFLPYHTNLSCSFSRGVLGVLVFALHPDSLMVRGACLKSGSMSKRCAV